MQKRAKVRRAVYAEGTQKSLHTDENKTEIYYERIEEKINYSCKRIDLESDRQSGHKSLRFERVYRERKDYSERMSTTATRRHILVMK